MSPGWRETLGGLSVGRWFHKQLFDVSNSQGLREQRPPGNETSVCQQGFLGALLSRGSSPRRQNPACQCLRSSFRSLRRFKSQGLSSE